MQRKLRNREKKETKESPKIEKEKCVERKNWQDKLKARSNENNVRLEREKSDLADKVRKITGKTINYDSEKGKRAIDPKSRETVVRKRISEIETRGKSVKISSSASKVEARVRYI